MNDEQIRQILRKTIPGAQATLPRNWPSSQERPWLFWERKEDKSKWAVFLIKGKRKPKTILESIKGCRKRRLKMVPCIMAPTFEEVEAIATAFRVQKIPIITEIAGKWSLLYPPKTESCKSTSVSKHPRISRVCINECYKAKTLPKWLKTGINSLRQKYSSARRRINDDIEMTFLEDFFSNIFKCHGFRKPPFGAARALRRLEQADWGGRRDHFFHSFENYFLGLWAILHTKKYFLNAMKSSKLSWNIEPEFVWFLTTMWHDVGHGLQNYTRIENELIGLPINGDDNSSPISRHLESEYVKKALREMASLIAHFQDSNPKTSWLAPQNRMRKPKQEKAIEKALLKDLQHSHHGTMGALRLYLDIMQFVNRISGSARQNTIRQSLLVAAISIPFHDWFFRKCVRESVGESKICLLTMPYAGLLSFIDSIQDDRRILGQNASQLGILDSLDIDLASKTISANIRDKALSDIDFIWKMIEARDVKMSLATSSESINFKYPDWMVCDQF